MCVFQNSHQPVMLGMRLRTYLDETCIFRKNNCITTILVICMLHILKLDLYSMSTESCNSKLKCAFFVLTNKNFCRHS